MADAANLQLAPLEDVAHCQSNRLHDVSALLKAIQVTVEAVPNRPSDAVLAEWRDRIHRLARVAGEAVDDVQDAFQPYI